MQHYLDLLQDVIVRSWDKETLTNYHGTSYTNSRIAEYITKLHMMFSKLGVEKGDKIALCGKNSAEWAIAFLAVTSYHAVAVPILNEFTSENVASLTDHSDSVILFTDKKIAGGMDFDRIPSLRVAINFENYSPIYVRDEEMFSVFAKTTVEYDKKYPNGITRDDVKFESSDLDQLAVINYTSGTTGSPKGIMLTYRNLSSNIEYGHRRIPVFDGDCSVSMLPLAHMYGLAIELLYTYLGGCHVYFLGKTPTPTILMQAFSEIRPYVLVTVPLVIEKIFKAKIMPVLDTPMMKFATSIPFLKKIIYSKVNEKLMAFFGGKVRDLIIGGAAISRPVEVLMHNMKVPYTVGFGMTECAPLIGYENWDRFLVGSCGKVVDNMQIRVDSENPQRIVGELQVKGANVMIGYYKNDDATKAAFTPDGWLRTGDLGIIDKNGNIFIKGRSKCMILSSSGQNIYPEEIENKLNNMPSVAESIVVERNKRLVAMISLQVDDERDDDSEKQLQELSDQIRATVNKMLPNYSQISKIEIRKEGFEHTPKHSIKRYLYR